MLCLSLYFRPEVFSFSTEWGLRITSTSAVGRCRQDTPDNKQNLEIFDDGPPRAVQEFSLYFLPPVSLTVSLDVIGLQKVSDHLYSVKMTLCCPCNHSRPEFHLKCSVNTFQLWQKWKEHGYNHFKIKTPHVAVRLNLTMRNEKLIIDNNFTGDCPG